MQQGVQVDRFAQHYFQYKQGDVFACMADVGWITGHSYIVYGPLCNGATSVIFESVPTYPDPGRYWEVRCRQSPVSSSQPLLSLHERLMPLRV